MPRSAFHGDGNEGFHGSLYVCGIIAQMWLFDQARGTTTSAFKECSFYLDGANSTFYCKRVHGDSAILTLFRSSKHTGSLIVDITMDRSRSALYLEVSDALHDARLRRQFQQQLRNPGRKVSPEEIGVNMVHGRKAATQQPC
jgi:hypothetical protein